MYEVMIVYMHNDILQYNLLGTCMHLRCKCYKSVNGKIIINVGKLLHCGPIWGTK